MSDAPAFTSAPPLQVSSVTIPVNVVNMILTYLTQQPFDPTYGVALREILAHALKLAADASFAEQQKDASAARTEAGSAAR